MTHRETGKKKKETQGVEKSTIKTKSLQRCELNLNLCKYSGLQKKKWSN